MKKIVCSVIIIVLIFSLLACSKKANPQLADNQPTQQPAPTETQEAATDKLPNFSSEDFLGNKVTQDIFKDNELTVINLWGTF